MNLKRLTVEELKALETRVSRELEERKKRLAVVSEVMEKVKEMGLEVSDLLNHIAARKAKKKSSKVT